MKRPRSHPGHKTLRNAVALAYSESDAAPRVVAKGHGILAEQIISRARDAGVYVHESPELVSLLMQIDLDQRIPPQLYVAVAELLAWLYRLESGGTAGSPPAFTAPPQTRCGALTLEPHSFQNKYWGKP